MSGQSERLVMLACRILGGVVDKNIQANFAIDPTVGDIFGLRTFFFYCKSPREARRAFELGRWYWFDFDRFDAGEINEGIRNFFSRRWIRGAQISRSDTRLVGITRRFNR